MLIESLRLLKVGDSKGTEICIHYILLQKIMCAPFFFLKFNFNNSIYQSNNYKILQFSWATEQTVFIFFPPLLIHFTSQFINIFLLGFAFDYLLPVFDETNHQLQILSINISRKSQYYFRWRSLQNHDCYFLQMYEFD